jgi:hypothetical protein
MPIWPLAPAVMVHTVGCILVIGPAPGDVFVNVDVSWQDQVPKKDEAPPPPLEPALLLPPPPASPLLQLAPAPEPPPEPPDDPELVPVPPELEPEVPLQKPLQFPEQSGAHQPLPPQPQEMPQGFKHNSTPMQRAGAGAGHPSTTHEAIAGRNVEKCVVSARTWVESAGPAITVV